MSIVNSDEKRFGVILADPPWQYRNRGVEGSAEAQYPTMTTKEIADLPIEGLALPDCVLLMWATWPALEDAFEIIKAWGFEYVTGMPWVKLGKQPVVDLFGETQMFPFYGIGFWVRGCSEPILIARRGNPDLPDYDFLGLISERMAHSRKPENIHHFAESLKGPYLELFARRSRLGWESWGNEIKNTVEIMSTNGEIKVIESKEPEKHDDEEWNRFVSEMQEAGWMASYTLFNKIANWRHVNGATVDGDVTFNRWRRGLGTPAPF